MRKVRYTFIIIVQRYAEVWKICGIVVGIHTLQGQFEPGQVRGLSIHFILQGYDGELVRDVPEVWEDGDAEGGGGDGGRGEGEEGDGDGVVGTVGKGHQVHIPPPLGDRRGVGVHLLAT